jgi:hypothetical protein
MEAMSMARAKSHAEQAEIDSLEVRIRELEAALQLLIGWFASRSGSPSGSARVSAAQRVLEGKQTSGDEKHGR